MPAQDHGGIAAMVVALVNSKVYLSSESQAFTTWLSKKVTDFAPYFQALLQAADIQV